MIYDKEHSGAISFPLGGIGAGCIGIAGNGSLVDWEIFNHADKGRRNGMSHFLLRAEKDGVVQDFRMLQGDLPAPYMGEFTDVPGHHGYGWGPDADTLANWPHFREHSFEGNFPVCKVNFSGEKFPGTASLTGWSVFIPGNSQDSSMPAAFIEIGVRAQEEMDFTVFGALDNPWGSLGKNSIAGSQLTVSCPEGEDELTLTLDEPLENISWQTCSGGKYWRDHQEKYYADILAGGRLKDRKEPEVRGTTMPHQFGILACHFHLKKDEERLVRFILTWHIPVRRNDWNQESQARAAEEGIPNQWRNWYATVWKNSRETGKYALAEYARLREGTFAFRDALFSSTIPEEIMEGISGNLSTLKTPTCLRLEDGTIWGWEGIGKTWGSCEGSCAHVWNYAQALAYLFPDLERTLRIASLKYGVDENGAQHFRIQLPLGIHAKPTDKRACADGQFGEIMKFYRDWQISQDDDFLRQWWPKLQLMMEYAWSEMNQDRWDRDKTGVLWGRQHHTLDMELFGPNIWLSAHYWGALRAMSIMARKMNNDKLAEQYLELSVKGRAWVERYLFNGEYFVQKLDLHDHDLVKSFEHGEDYIDQETGEICYQLGDGCPIDSQLAQWYAKLYGLGTLYSNEKNLSLLKSIFKYNFRSSLRDVVNLWRMYSLNDEGGTMICSWPHGGRPTVPIPYNSETMDGFEWAFAGHLISEGLIQEGETVAKAIRNRYDGRKRNPWNEFECGNNYARSMASYGLLASYSGFVFQNGTLTFEPIKDGVYFWSIGKAWGTFSIYGKDFSLKVIGGKLDHEKLCVTTANVAYCGDI